MPPIPESQRSSVPIRVPKVLLGLLDEAGAKLTAERGGRWSRGETARVVVTEWLERRASQEELPLDDRQENSGEDGT